MKNLKLLNKNHLSIILFYLFFGLAAESEEVIDIWNIENKKSTENVDVLENTEEIDVTQNSIYKMQSQKDNKLNIEEDQTLITHPNHVCRFI